MTKKKLKNNVSNFSLSEQELEIAARYPAASKLIKTPLGDGSVNLGLKANVKTNAEKNEFKKDRLERLVKMWLERLSKKCDIATDVKERYLHLLLKLILPPIVKGGFEGKLKILQALNVASQESNSDIPTISSSTKLQQSDSFTLNSTLDLNPR